MNVSDEELVAGGLDPAAATAVVEARDALEKARKATVSQRRRETIRFRFKRGDLPEDVDRLRRIVIHPAASNGARQIHLFSLSGIKLGVFRLRRPIPDWWQTGDLADALITNIDQTDTDTMVAVEMREL